MPPPVNLLFLLTDQQRHDALGCANPLYQTPHLDALAARGLRFSQAVCNNPMCVPSRHSLMTGLYSSQLGVRHNTQMAPTDADLALPTLAQRLQAAGYQTAGCGKTHWYIGERIMPGVPTVGSKRGFEFRAIAGAPGPENHEPDSLYQNDDDPEATRVLAKEAAQGGPGGESVSGYVGGPSQVDGARHREGWLTRQALRFLEHERDRSKPFFLYLGFDYPHPGFFVPPSYEARYNLADFPDNPPPAPLPGGHMAGRLEDRWPKMTAAERQRSRLRYAALNTYVDELYGQVLTKLADLGELDNTLVVFASDHGEMLGDRARTSKYCLYEGSVRVPLIVAGPGVAAAKRGTVDARPAELVDLLPTFLAAAGQAPEPTLPGFNLLSDFQRSGSFAEMHGRGYEEFQRMPAVMYRTAAWKLILTVKAPLGSAFGRYDDLEGELYDLKADPLELRNLYGSTAAAVAAVREQLTAQALMHVMACAGKYPGLPTRASLTVTGPETKPDRSLW